MWVTIEYKPESLEETKDLIASFGRYGTEKTYWNIPSKFKKQVFEFLERLAVPHKDVGESHIQDRV